MKLFLEGLLPRVLPDLRFLCVTHEGKQDLERSIPRKLRAWDVPGDQFVIVRDNDGADCRELKGRLLDLCGRAGRPESLVRIACQELEAWYFGDLQALAIAFKKPAVESVARDRRFREADEISSPGVELRKLIPEYSKREGARRMAEALVVERNTSRSFQVFLAGLGSMIKAGSGASSP